MRKCEKATTNIHRNILLMFRSSLALLPFLAHGGYSQEAMDASAVEMSSNFVQTYCVDCHNIEDWAGSIAFDSMDLGHVDRDQKDWETAIGRLRGRMMPPGGALQPTQDDVDAMVSFLETAIDTSDAEHEIGYVPIQRLSRTEYAASVKELVGVEVDPAQILPPDIEVEGFDNIASALGASPSFLEQYISAARFIASDAVGSPVPKFANVFHEVGARDANNHRDGYPLGTRGGMKFTHVFKSDGEYRFNVLDIDAGLYPRGMETASTMVILVDGVEANRLEIGGPEDLAIADRDGAAGRVAMVQKVSGIPANIEVGTHEIMVTFIERSWAASNNSAGSGRVTGMPRIGLGIEVEGPYEPSGLSLSASRSKIFVCQPETQADQRPCAERIALNLAQQAFRRPVGNDDLDWLMPFYEMGQAEEGGFDAGILELVTAILSSPDFLYRSIGTATGSDTPYTLNNFELASRLSFFLWSQGPDEELFSLASAGQLTDQTVMEAQVKRMLADPKAQSLIENFALAWLNLDELDQIQPTQQPFSDAMRTNFETEISLFLSSVLLEEHSVHELLTADWTYVNNSLAQHYGLPDVYGSQFRKVVLEDGNRWGLLGKGAVLLRTSYGDRTSPVLRGAWILDRIMGSPPTPPPPNVEVDLSIREGEAATTVRARLENHRQNPTCMACHSLIDPPGLSLENFDVTGRWRDVDVAAGVPIDVSTELTSGKKMNGPVELRNHLLSIENQLPTTVTKRLMMYALNREIEYSDMPQLREIVRESAEKNYTFRSIVTAIVNSDSFRKQGYDGQGSAIAAMATVQTAVVQTNGVSAKQ